jgi:hypothetical protein
LNKILSVFFCVICGAVKVYGQLPGYTATAKVKDENFATTTVSPIVRKDKTPASLVTVLYQTPMGRGAHYTAEVSTIERFNTSGAAIADRGNHLSAYQAVDYTIKYPGSSFPEIKVHISNFLIWDMPTFRAMTQQWELCGGLKFSNQSSVDVMFWQRADQVEEPFTLGKVVIGPDEHVLRNITIRYSSKMRGRFRSYIEATKGVYYMRASRHSIRLGEKVKLTPKLSGFVDVEFTQIAGENIVEGYLSRMQLEYKINKELRAGLFAVNNTFSHFNGVLAYVQFTRNHHTFKVEYREVRTDFRFVESTHPFFASHALVQYRFTLMN